MDQDKFIDNCLDVYGSGMEDAFDTTHSIRLLEEFHLELKSEILDELPQKWRSAYGSPIVPDAVKQNLSQKLDSEFQKLSRHFEKLQKMKQSQLTSQLVVKDSMDLYNDEMDKYFQNHPNARTKEIEIYHSKLWKKTFEYAKSKSVGVLSHQWLCDLKREIEERQKFYFEKATMTLKANEDPAIGIDLGTTMCCVMVFYRGKCELVQNRAQSNSNTTPSYVAFHENKTNTFGSVAKEDAYKYPKTTIYDAKRMIGRPMTDEKLKSDIKKWPFEVVEDNGYVKISTWDTLRHPHEISAQLLTYLRFMADDHLNLPRGTIEKAVITVPAYFTEPQRRATYEAATCAGLRVLSIFSEPTAAAVAYAWERRSPGKRNVLVYDLGGGTFDVAIAKVDEKNVEILCVDGDTHLGGQDFDQLLMDYCIKEFLNEKGINLETGRDSEDYRISSETRSALSRLKLQCEKAKERLSSTDKTSIEILRIKEAISMSVVLTKILLENLVRPLVQQTLDITARAMTEALSHGIPSKDEINDVILVGGSTRMPLVQEMVSEFFGGKELSKHINPDEAVAYGAAIRAAILNQNESIGDIKVEDVTPMSLGTEVVKDGFSVIIPKNTKVPCTRCETYVTVSDNQTKMLVSAYQGENLKASENKLLGNFILDGFPPKPKGQEKAIVTMTIDVNGILHVEAVSTTTGGSNSITITSNRLEMKEASIYSRSAGEENPVSAL